LITVDPILPLYGKAAPRRFMRGFLGRITQSSQPGLSCGDGPIGQLLRPITHGATVAAPEAVAEVTRLALQNEEDLAVALRHVEENVVATPAEWRRVHGSLQLLQSFLQPESAGADDNDPLIGRIWFETKIQDRLVTLSDFDYGEDSRVSSLIRRLASNCRRLAEKNVLVDCDVLSDEDRHSSSRPESVRSAESTGELHRPVPASSKAAISTIGKPSGVAEKPVPDLGGDRRDPCDESPLAGRTWRRAEAAAKGSLRSAASALDALRDMDTKTGLSERDRLASTPTTPSSPQPRRCCGCLWRILGEGNAADVVPQCSPSKDSDLDSNISAGEASNLLDFSGKPKIGR